MTNVAPTAEKKTGILKGILNIPGATISAFKEIHEAIHHPRCIAIDLGASHIKYALCQADRKRLTLLKTGTIDIKGSALLNNEEIDLQIAKIIKELGEYPIALGIPQNLVNSRIVDLPNTVDQSNPKTVHDYLLQYTTQGLNAASFALGYRKLKKFGTGEKIRRPYYATLVKRASITEIIGRFLHTAAPIFYIAPNLNTLATSYIYYTKPQATHILIDIGAISTHAIIISNQQCILAANFPIGAEYFTEQLSKALRCTFEEAEQLKRQNNYLTGEHVNAIFQTAVRRWLKDLMAWFTELAISTANIQGTKFDQEKFTQTLQLLPIYITGGTVDMPGFTQYITEKSQINFQHIPQYQTLTTETPTQPYATCIGLALEALGIAPSTGNLTPQNLIDATITNTIRFHTLNIAGILLLILLIALTLTTITLSQNIPLKTTIHNETKTTLYAAQSIAKLYDIRDKEIFYYGPLLRMHKRTIDLSNIIKAQQQLAADATNPVWFLTLADKHTFLLGQPTLDNHTNQTIAMNDREDFSLGKYTYITELCTITNASADPQKYFLNAIRDRLTNLYFIDYADTLLSQHYSGTNRTNPKYLTGGDRFGAIFTTKPFITDANIAHLTNFVKDAPLPTPAE